MVAFGTCNFSTAKTAAALDLDALSAELHSSADGLLHSSSEGYTVFKLCSDVFCNELCIHIRCLNFNDVDSYRLTDHLFNLSTDLFDVLAASSDNDTGLSAVNMDSYLISKSFDLDLGNACCIKFLLDIITNVVIFYEGIAESCFVSKPAGVPIFDYAYTKAVGINFLSHLVYSFRLILFPLPQELHEMFS